MINKIIKSIIWGIVLFLILAMSGSNIFATNTFLKTNDTLKKSLINITME